MLELNNALDGNTRTNMVTQRIGAACFAVITIIVALIAFFFLYMNADWVTDDIIAKMPNATKAEVIKLLGEPESRSKRELYERWFYRSSARLAEFRVDFSLKGNVDDWSYDR